MATKITKSELKELIREALREELAQTRRTRTKVTESPNRAAPTGAYVLVNKNGKYLASVNGSIKAVDKISDIRQDQLYATVAEMQEFAGACHQAGAGLPMAIWQLANPVEAREGKEPKFKKVKEFKVVADLNK